jgi:multiple sugar transport system substrate-binding protein
MRLEKALLGILLFIAVLFFVCPAVGSTVAETEKGETTVSEEAFHGPSNTTINVLIAGALYEFSCKLFEERIKDSTGVALSLVDISGIDLLKQVKQLLGEEGADLVCIPPSWIPELAEEGLILPLEENGWELDPSVDDIIAPFLQFYCSYDDKLYALPLDGDVRLFYYRKDLVENPAENEEFEKRFGYSLAVPKTYEESADFARFFTRRRGQLLAGKPLEHDFFGTGMALGQGWCHYDWLDRFLSYGGMYFNREFKPDIGSEAGVKALDDIRSLMEFVPPGVLSWGYQENRDAFLAGKLASMVLWSDFFKFVHDSQRSEVRGMIGVATVPGVRRGGANLHRVLMPGGSVFALPSSTKEREAALRVAAYMSAAASSELTLDPRTRCDPFRYSHTRRAEALSVYLTEISGGAVAVEECSDYLDTVRDAMENGVPELNLPHSREYVDLLDLYIHRTLRGELEPEEALFRTVNEWGRISEQVGYEKQRRIWEVLYGTWEELGYAD